MYKIETVKTNMNIFLKGMSINYVSYQVGKYFSFEICIRKYYFIYIFSMLFFQ